jgi:hypothetical protein
MPDSRPLPAPVLKERREQIISVLSAHFAEDRLTLEQLETRLDLALRATTPAELESLVADLPVPNDATAAARVPANRPRASLEAVRDHQVLVAIMGGVERRGRWTPARRTLVVALMGGAELDLREAVFPEGETEIFIFAFWGGVEIIVTPDVHVDVGGIAIMGGFGHRSGAAAEPTPGAPVVKLNGIAIMGGVEVMVRYPGETAKDAQRRLRDARKRGGPAAPGGNG